MTTAEYTTPPWGSAGRDEPRQGAGSRGLVHHLLRPRPRRPAARGEIPPPHPPRDRFRPARAAPAAGGPDPRRALRLRPPRRGPGPARLPGGGRRPLARDARGGAAPLRGAAAAHLRAG